MSVPLAPRTGVRSRRPRTLVLGAAVALLTVTASVSTVSTSTAATDSRTEARSGASEDTWSLVGTENFSRLDRSRWHVYDGREQSSDSGARPWRARVHQGALRLTSGREKNGSWSSATVGGWNWDAANLREGRVDMRVMTGRGTGVETNLMMWPDASAGLPALDLYSSPANWRNRQSAQQRTHFRSSAGATQRRTSVRRADFTRWRTVSVRWDSSAVTYLVDGRITRVDKAAHLIPTATLWPLLQTRVHRDARGRLPRGTRGPTTSVDWIRVYERPVPPTDPETPVDPETPPTDPEPPTQPEPPTPPTEPEPPVPPTQPEPPVPPTEPEPPAEPGWVSVGRDDFNGTRLDTSKWTTFSGVPGCCKDTVWSGSQVEVSGGELVLHNRLTADGWRSGGVGGWRWTDTVQQYGRIDARMKFDKGRGFSAAALTWPSNNTWPPELDFYEIYETRGDRDMMAQSTHYKKPSAANGRGVDQKFNRDLDFSDWQTISVRWSATELTYWINGKKVHTIRDRDVIPHTKMWIGFQTHAHKMDGQWPTMPKGQDTVAFRVDWVEVFTQR